jgi:hypothetical protein
VSRSTGSKKGISGRDKDQSLGSLRLPLSAEPVRNFPDDCHHIPRRCRLFLLIPSNKLRGVARGATDARGNVLVRIKRAVLAGRYAFSEKARVEMETDSLTELDVAESILNAVAIYKTVRSSNARRVRVREYLHIIQSTNLSGLPIYSKGKLVKEAGQERYYFLISSKRAF